MEKWIEYDPLTGVKETNVANEDGTNQVIVTKEQDVEGLLDRQHALRREGATDEGIKKGFWCYATIPLVVQYELLKKGINIFRAEDHKRAFEEINANYPYLKSSNKVHSVKPKRMQKRETSTQPGILLSAR